MHKRLLQERLSRGRPFCILGATGVGKTTMISSFAGKFSNWIHLDLETAVDRQIFESGESAGDILQAISFLKGKDIRGNGTLIILDEICRSPAAIRWVGGFLEERTGGQAVERTGMKSDKRTSGRADGPFIVAVSSVMTKELAMLVNSANGMMDAYYLSPFSFEEFLMVMDDTSALEAFREVPVPYYAYEKLLHYFHLYALIGGMPEITSEYAVTRHLTGLKNIYEKIEDQFDHCLAEVTAGARSLGLAMEVLQNTYPFAATRISLSRFGNLEKGSREIRLAFEALAKIFFLHMIYPVTTVSLPLAPDTSKFPRLQLLDTGLVNYFSGIQKPLFQSHDMNAIFAGQVARQAVGQEIVSAENPVEWDALHPNFWIRNKSQSTAEVDFVIAYNGMLIPVVVKSGEPGRLRSLHQFMDIAPHSFAVRLYAEKLAVQQTQTIRGKKFYLLNLPYFLAGKIREHLKGFMRLADGT